MGSQQCRRNLEFGFKTQNKKGLKKPFLEILTPFKRTGKDLHHLLFMAVQATALLTLMGRHFLPLALFTTGHGPRPLYQNSLEVIFQAGQRWKRSAPMSMINGVLGRFWRNSFKT
jgi:hypothetical protein